jgi:hypothetical protein
MIRKINDEKQTPAIAARELKRMRRRELLKLTPVMALGGFARKVGFVSGLGLSAYLCVSLCTLR